MNAQLISADPSPGTRLVDAYGYPDLLQRQAQLFTSLTQAASDERGWLGMRTRHVASLVTQGKLVVTLIVTKKLDRFRKTTQPVMSRSHHAITRCCKELLMFWIVSLFAGMALVFVKLGVLSITVKLLTFAVNLLIVIVVIMGVILLWKTVKDRKIRSD